MNIAYSTINDWESQSQMESYIRKMERPFKKKHSALIAGLTVIGLSMLFIAYFGV